MWAAVTQGPTPRVTRSKRPARTRGTGAACHQVPLRTGNGPRQTVSTHILLRPLGQHETPHPPLTSGPGDCEGHPNQRGAWAPKSTPCQPVPVLRHRCPLLGEPDPSRGRVPSASGPSSSARGLGVSWPSSRSHCLSQSVCAGPSSFPAPSSVSLQTGRDAWGSAVCAEPHRTRQGLAWGQPQRTGAATRRGRRDQSPSGCGPDFESQCQLL